MGVCENIRLLIFALLYVFAVLKACPGSLGVQRQVLGSVGLPISAGAGRRGRDRPSPGVRGGRSPPAAEAEAGPQGGFPSSPGSCLGSSVLTAGFQAH